MAGIGQSLAKTINCDPKKIKNGKTFLGGWTSCTQTNDKYPYAFSDMKATHETEKKRRFL